MGNARDFFPTQYTTGQGKSDYIVDVDDGDCQVSVDVRSNKEVAVLLHYSNDPDVKPIVYGTGKSIFGRFNVKGLTAIRLLPANKDAIVTYKVEHRLRRMSDPINDHIVSLPVPPPTVSLAELVSRQVAERLGELTGEKDPQIDLEELIDDLPNDVDEEFGPGYMEMDAEFDAKYRAKAAPDPVPANPTAPPPERVQQPVEPTQPAKQTDPRLAEIERLLVSLKGEA